MGTSKSFLEKPLQRSNKGRARQGTEQQRRRPAVFFISYKVHQHSKYITSNIVLKYLISATLFLQLKQSTLLTENVELSSLQKPVLPSERTGKT